MTPEQLREIDALIAVRMMNWRGPVKEEPLPVVLRLSQSPFIPDIELIPPGRDSYRPVPRYTTEIAAAWEVFELPIFDAWAIARSAKSGKYEIFNPWTQNTIISEADTAPLAICLAALRASGVEVGVGAPG